MFTKYSVKFKNAENSSKRRRGNGAGKLFNCAGLTAKKKKKHFKLGFFFFVETRLLRLFSPLLSLSLSFLFPFFNFHCKLGLIAQKSLFFCHCCPLNAFTHWIAQIKKNYVLLKINFFFPKFFFFGFVFVLQNGGV